MKFALIIILFAALLSAQALAIPSYTECTDSDGRDYSVAGKVTAMNVENETTIPKEFNDYCQGRLIIFEYICKDNHPKKAVSTCIFGCSGGKCNPWPMTMCNDTDKDGYGDPRSYLCRKRQKDCNNMDADIHPGAAEICGNGIDEDCNGVDHPCSGGCTDNDNDGYGDPASAECDRPSRDCDDSNSDINPGAAEACGNNIDEDCSGTDLSCSVGCVDADSDGWPSISGNCTHPLKDCDDNNPDAHPGGTEICGNHVDEDCNGADLPCTAVCTDNDNDGYGSPASTSCNHPEEDCDDANPQKNPGHAETCGNGIDEDCSGSDLPCAPTCTDNDSDGYGSPASPSCSNPQSDCNDSNSTVHPGAAEVCGNGADEDCNGADLPCTPACTDNDNDGYGNPASSGCEHPERDCNDSDPVIHPGMTEACNGLDDNCDSVTDSLTRSCSVAHKGICAVGTETCGSGVWTGCPTAQAELCGNSIDEDCDGTDTPCAGPVCGNGDTETGEECDDGNTLAGDGCSPDCKNEEEGFVCPTETPCKDKYWPAHYGNSVSFNEDNKACDLFEVCHPSLEAFAKEAFDCCENGCTASCHEFCDESRAFAGISGSATDAQLKKCRGRYIIYGFGPGKRLMKSYFSPEVCCTLGVTTETQEVCESKDCDSKIQPIATFNNNAQALPCRGAVGSPDGWVDDSDMSKNSCVISDLPAHADINILNTGICMDYSIAATTMLRTVGYGRDEVYTLLGPGHGFNLIKFPGDSKYIIFDATENADYFDVGGTTYGNDPTQPNYCDCIKSSLNCLGATICGNDFGKATCPRNTDIKGC